jgi:hypothetical protein
MIPRLQRTADAPIGVATSLLDEEQQRVVARAVAPFVSVGEIDLYTLVARARMKHGVRRGGREAWRSGEKKKSWCEKMYEREGGEAVERGEGFIALIQWLKKKSFCSSSFSVSHGEEVSMYASPSEEDDDAVASK